LPPELNCTISLPPDDPYCREPCMNGTGLNVTFWSFWQDDPAPRQWSRRYKRTGLAMERLIGQTQDDTQRSFLPLTAPPPTASERRRSHRVRAAFYRRSGLRARWKRTLSVAPARSRTCRLEARYPQVRKNANQISPRIRSANPVEIANIASTEGPSSPWRASVGVSMTRVSRLVAMASRLPGICALRPVSRPRCNARYGVMFRPQPTPAVS